MMTSATTSGMGRRTATEQVVSISEDSAGLADVSNCLVSLGNRQGTLAGIVAECCCRISVMADDLHGAMEPTPMGASIAPNEIKGRIHAVNESMTNLEETVDLLEAAISRLGV